MPAEYTQLLFQPWALIAGGIVAVLLALGVWRYGRKLPPRLKRYWGLGVGVKVLAFGALHLYYHGQGGGDIFRVGFAAQVVCQTALQQPAQAWHLLGVGAWNSPQTDAHISQTYGPQFYEFFLFPETSTENLNYLRLTVLLRLLGLGSYWGGALLAAAFSWVCAWHLLLALLRLKEDQPSRQAEWLLVGILLVLPASTLWTAGPLKEAVLWGLACVLLRHLLGLHLGQRHLNARTLAQLAMLLAGLATIKLTVAMLLGVAAFAVCTNAVARTLPVLRRQAVLRYGVCVLALGGCVAAAEALGRGPDYLAGYTPVTRQWTLDAVRLPAPAPPDQVSDLPPFTKAPHSLLPVLPLGFVAGFCEPWPWQLTTLRRLPLVLEALFHLALLLALGWAVRQSFRKPNHLRWNGFACTLVVLGVGYTAFVGLAMPFYGSVARMRAVSVPLLFLGLWLWAFWPARPVPPDAAKA